GRVIRSQQLREPGVHRASDRGVGGGPGRVEPKRCHPGRRGGRRGVRGHRRRSPSATTADARGRVADGAASARQGPWGSIYNNATVRNTELQMQNFNADYENGSGRRSPAFGGSSGTQLVVGIVAILLGSVFLLGGFVLWVGEKADRLVIFPWAGRLTMLVG